MSNDNINGANRAIDANEVHQMVCTESGVLKFLPLHNYQRKEAEALSRMPDEQRLERTICALNEGADAIVIPADIARIALDPALPTLTKRRIETLGPNSRALVQKATISLWSQQSQEAARRPASRGAGAVPQHVSPN